MNRKKTKLLLFITIFFTTILFAAGAETGAYKYQAYTGASTLSAMQEANRMVAKKVLPVVVSINVETVEKREVPTMPSPFDFFFNFPGRPQNPNQQPQEKPKTQEFRSEALGSGIIVKKTGTTVYVLTNNHVAGNADKITIHLYDDRVFDAKLVGKDPRKDIALVKFTTKEDVPIADLGDSDTVQAGDIAFAVGNPLGFSSTITSGIISAVGRKADDRLGTSFTDYIQTDAAINPGNSGGPLVNIKGQVIGINTWIASQSGGSIGLGFAIPINNAKKVINELISSGKVEYGWLGISMSDPSEGIARDMGLTGKDGAFVFNVYKGSPAWKGGIKPGDYITKIDSHNIKDADDLLHVVGNLEPGKTYSFRVIRYNNPVNLRVKIATRKDEEEIIKDSKSLWPGVTVVGITKDIQERLNLKSNIGKVMIGAVSQNTSAFKAGLRSGDIVKEINRKKINSVMDFYRIINNAHSKEFIFKVNKQGTDVILGIVP
ncbi:MAG: hypothetical protein DRP59_08785 [Spirochaetes bacterium]|nr:MAG: hypothetical protein DRP59_08785 [Spirochaetota bacterium]